MALEGKTHKGGSEPIVVLQFKFEDNGRITITSIQRERTRGCYSRKRAPSGKVFVYTWVPALEHAKTLQIKSQLGNIHPSEFLLAEFIYRNREKIKSDLKAEIPPILELESTDTFSSGTLRRVYGGIIERYFTKLRPADLFEGRRGGLFACELNQNSGRVRALLCL